ncbi:MAG: XrtA-associated ATPase [Proteobacteria bacterium]|nr:XrtA-associated ATPase [Pseudomonadota bacterium]
MYEKFYGFKEKPFSLLADPAFLYLSKKHELALTYLEYGLSEQAGFIVITGEVGSGKTTLIKYLINKLETTATPVAMIFNTNISPCEFLEIIIKEWNLNCAGREKSVLYETINNFLLQEYIKRHKVVLIIDEAQNLSSETLEEIRMISNFNDEKQPLVHIILLGQPNLRDRLNQSALEQLRQRISVHYHLGPLDYDEVVEYVKHRLKRAGSPRVDIFTSDALESIFNYSRGIPRVINIVCDTALVYGFAEGIETIGAPIIENVIEDRVKGGIGIIESSTEMLGAGHQGSNPLAKEIEHLKEQYELLNESISELSLLMKRLYATQDGIKKVNGYEPGQYKNLLEAPKKKNRHVIAVKKVNRGMNKLMERVKCLEKKVSEQQSQYSKTGF